MEGSHIADSMGRGGGCAHTQELSQFCHLSVTSVNETLKLVPSPHPPQVGVLSTIAADCKLCLFDTVELSHVAYGIAFHTHTHTHTRTHTHTHTPLLVACVEHTFGMTPFLRLSCMWGFFNNPKKHRNSAHFTEQHPELRRYRIARIELHLTHMNGSRRRGARR